MAFSNLSRMFSPADKALIACFIHDAEKRSGCEIIPVVARDSGRYDRAEDMFGLVLALAGLAVAWALTAMLGGQDGMWAAPAADRIGLVGIIGIILAGFIGGAFLATRLPILKLPFLSRAEMNDEVARAARACFYSRGLRKAPNAAGILIYVSLFERRVVVLGDDAVAAKLSAGDWQRITDVMRGAMKIGAARDGLLTSIHLTGMLLDGAFPPPTDADGGFADELVLLD